MNLFRRTTPQSDPIVPRSPMTISQALEAARQAGRLTPDTGLFDQWLRAKGLSTRGNILIARMRREYEEVFEERFAAPPVIVCQPADGRKLNRLFLERHKGGDASCRPNRGLRSDIPAGEPRANDERSVTGDDPAGSISALYASGKASSLKEALAILGGGR